MSPSPLGHLPDLEEYIDSILEGDVSSTSPSPRPATPAAPAIDLARHSANSAPESPPSPVLPAGNPLSSTSTSTSTSTSLARLFSYNAIRAPEDRLHARHATLFADAAKKLAIQYNSSPTEKTILDLLLLPKAGLTLGLQSEGFSVSYVLRHYPDSAIPAPEAPEAPGQRQQNQTRNRQENQTENQPECQPRLSTNSYAIRRAQRLVRRGFLSRAARALAEPTDLAANSAETLEQLRLKHPRGPRNPFSLRASPPVGGLPDEDDVTAAINSFPVDTAPGPSGWTVPLLKEAAKRPDFVKFVAKIARQFQLGTLPAQQLFTASRLVAIAKKDGGVRPIAVGELFYRLIAKIILRKDFQPSSLATFQLGVQSPGGVEPAIHLLQEVVAGKISGYNYVTALDFKNAFNSVDRLALSTGILANAPEFFRAARWAYQNPSQLITSSGDIIESSQGVRQGDPLGPFFFSLAIRATLEGLQRDLTNEATGPPPILIAYLDDIYIASAARIPLSRLETLLENAPISLNASKSKTTSVRQIRTEGLAALGSYLGPLAYRQQALSEATAKLEATISRTLELTKQEALLLLRSSSQLLFRHLPRTVDPRGLSTNYAAIDEALLAAIRTLRGDNSSYSLDKDLTALPERLGGLGIPLYTELATVAYTASREASREVINRILPPGVELSAELPPEPAEPPDIGPSSTSLPTSSSTTPSAILGASRAVFTPRSRLEVPEKSPRSRRISEERPPTLEDASETITRKNGESPWRTFTSQELAITLRPFFAAFRPLDGKEPSKASKLPRDIYRGRIATFDQQRLARVVASLGPKQLAILAENKSYLGRRWLSSLPSTKVLELDDSELASALRIRMLLRGKDAPAANLAANAPETPCSRCGELYFHGHEDTCKARTRKTAYRHDFLCRELNRAIAAIPGTRSTIEPRVSGVTAARGDLEVVNSSGTTYYDLTVVAVTAKSAAKDPFSTLNTAELDKKRKYSALGNSLKPLVFSPGGLLGARTSTEYKAIQQALSYSGATYLDRILSVTLARFRAATWIS